MKTKFDNKNENDNDKDDGSNTAAENKISFKERKKSPMASIAPKSKRNLLMIEEDPVKTVEIKEKHINHVHYHQFIYLVQFIYIVFLINLWIKNKQF